MKQNKNSSDPKNKNDPQTSGTIMTFNNTMTEDISEMKRNKKQSAEKIIATRATTTTTTTTTKGISHSLKKLSTCIAENLPAPCIGKSVVKYD